MNSPIENLDVLILGAGLAGIGSACQLRRRCPEKSFAILEARAVSGGTWDLFRYPGIRSDSDMYTYSYGFKPWRKKSTIATGESILSYIRETAEQYQLNDHIRYQHKVIAANWCSKEKRWSVLVERGDQQEVLTIRCRFILSCCGYYDYEQGHFPEFEGIQQFSGQVVHPQHWPQNLDYKDKRVVIIGSGATAVTLLPTLAQKAASTTMLQRSPTYIASVPSEDPWLNALSKCLPASWTFRLIRWKKVIFQRYIYRLSRSQPKRMRGFLLSQVRKELGKDYDVKKHFAPIYNPWDQRLCAVPDGDLFSAIRQQKAQVVTDHIDRFNANGIQLKSGQQLDADIVVVATGLKLKFGGGIAYSLDGQAIQLKDHFVYRGTMFSGVPNLAVSVGYTNSSWTLKTDLTSKYVCDLLKKMDRKGYQSVTPIIKGDMQSAPILDFDAGYVLRAREHLPKNGDRLPWKNHDDYLKDFIGLRMSKKKFTELKFQ